MGQMDYNKLVFEMIPNVDDQADFYAYLRKGGFGTDDFGYEYLLRIHRRWAISKRRGKNSTIIDIKRRKQFGPGKYHGASAGTVHLNKNHVKGWRGINPCNP